MARVTVADVIGQQLRRAFAGALRDVRQQLDVTSRDAGLNTWQAVKTDYLGDSLTPADMAEIAALGEVPILGPVATFLELVNKAGHFVLEIASGWALGSFFAEAMRPLWNEITHDIWDTFPSELIDPATAARLESKGIPFGYNPNDEARGGGLNDARFAGLVADITNRPDVATALEMLRRGEVGEATTAENLRRLGYEQPIVVALLKLSRNLLSPADLALAVLRGFADRTEAEAYAARLGIDAADFQTLIDNTGEPPGVMDLLEAYRRDFIGRDRLVHGIRESRVRDEWVDVIEKLRYSPMSTADATRAFVENYISDDEGAAIAQQNGLLPEHWPIVRDSWGRPLAHEQMASLVFRGLASRAQFDQAMRESDIKNKYIEQSFEVAARLMQERLIVDAIKYGAIDLQTGAGLLMQQGYTPESVKVLLKLGLRETSASTHELTRSEITALYTDHILSRDDALKQLEAIGLPETVANYVLELIDAQTHAKEVRAEVSITRISYLSGGIDEAAAQKQLTDMGLSVDQAQYTLGTWNREKHRATRTLSESQIVKATKNAVFTPDEAITLLEGIGYSRANAATLLLSNGILLSAPTPAG